jgi:class 3 adenylate cyclase
MGARTAALATSPGTIEASDQFIDAYADLDRLDAADLDEASDLVDEYYREEFTPALQETIGTTVGWRTLLPVADAAVYLQRHYVVGPGEEEERPLVDDAGDGTSWSEVHRELHLGFLEIAARLEVADLYLIEPATGTIVYSVMKGTDFATSLDTGPHGGSTLAAAMRTVRDAPERGAVTMTDLAPYVPDLGDPMLFMAGPVLDGDELVAILVLKIPGEPIDEIMTGEQAWVEEGFGVTGESYLLAGDGRMRSIARPLVEDPGAFLSDLATAGTATEEERRAIAGVGTTAVFLRAGDVRELADQYDAGESVIETTNYLQRSVLTAVVPLEQDGLDWLVLAEIEREEVAGPIDDFRRALLIAVAIFVIAITFATVAWAGNLFRPVRAISEKLRRVHDGESDEETPETPRSPQDFVDLADSIDNMLGALHQRQADLESASQERLSTLRSLLPPAIAERVEAGDRNVIDQVPQAGIVVLVVEGLGELVRLGQARQLLDRLVEEIDGLAIHHGLERVKLVGDTYLAGCGLSRPYLDHVPRSVAFALDARDVVREMSTEFEITPTVAAGVHTGPVTLGLAGSARLVYDMWGETVSAAHLLARLARPGEILVSGEARPLLPPDVSVVERGGRLEGPPVWEVLGQRAAAEDGAL